MIQLDSAARKQVARLEELIARVDNEWAEIAEDGKVGDDQYLSHLVRTAYFATLTLLERLQLRVLASVISDEWTANKSNPLRGEMMHALGEARLATTNPLREAIGALEVLDIAPTNVAYEPSFEHAVRILKNTKLAAARLEKKFEREKDLDAFCESQLLATFPDLNSNPALSLSNSYRQPDSSIESIKTLVEYKHLRDKADSRKIIDEIQADIRNYAGKGFNRLIVLLAQSEWFLRQEAVDADVLAEPTSFENLVVIVDRV